jgi:two-component system sensor histidine kinase KdpD
MLSGAILVPALFVAAIALALQTVRLHAARRAHTGAMELRDVAQQTERAATRALRLAEHDLRSIGMTLHGHAEQLAMDAQPRAAAVAAAASDLFDMADDLHDQTLQPGGSRVLSDQQVDLQALVSDALANVTAAIGPGRRNWRIAKDLAAVSVAADRRAMRHALTRVLANAVRMTRHNDWIEISVQPHSDGLALVIEDEGAGLFAPDSGACGGHDTRGIGMRLTLARTLMEAHGGRVEVAARTGVGTRVSLVFPAARVRQSPIRPLHSYAEPPTAAAAAGL